MAGERMDPGTGLHVLIGFAEALPAPEVVFSLLAAGHRVSVFLREGASAPLVGRLPVGGPLVLPAPERDAAGAVAALRAHLLGPEAPDLVMPLDDTGLWLVDAAVREGGTFPPVAGATGALARLALDKTEQVAAAAAAGFAVPQTEIARDAGDIAQSRILPAIIRPALALQEAGGRMTKGDARYILTEADRAALGTDPSGLTFPALVQPLIRGVGEGVFGFAGAAGVTAWSGHRRLRMMNPHGSGASACMAVVPGAELREAAAAMLGRAGWRGPFMIELLRDAEGRAWFVELNGRPWGSLALARRGGFEYPAWAVAQLRDPGFVPPEGPAPAGQARPLVLRHLGRDLLHLLFVLRGPKSAFHAEGWPRFWPALAAVLRPGPARGFYNHDPAFPRFFLADAWATVRRMIRR